MSQVDIRWDRCKVPVVRAEQEPDDAVRFLLRFDNQAAFRVLAKLADVEVVRTVFSGPYYYGDVVVELRLRLLASQEEPEPEFPRWWDARHREYWTAEALELLDKLRPPN